MEEDKYYCPYCNSELIKKPVKKSKCKSCGKFIYVKYTPYNRVKKLVTEDAAIKIDNEWNQYYYEQGKMSLCESYKLNLNDFNNIVNSIKEVNPPLEDIEINIILKYYTENKVSVHNYWYLNKLVSLLNEKGIDTFDYQKAISVFKLFEITKSGIMKAEISCFKDRCPNYDKLNGIIVNIPSEVKLPKIPNRECTMTNENGIVEYHICYCKYRANFDNNKWNTQ